MFVVIFEKLRRINFEVNGNFFGSLVPDLIPCMPYIAFGVTHHTKALLDIVSQRFDSETGTGTDYSQSLGALKIRRRIEKKINK